MALLITLFLVLINIFNNITTNSPKAEGLTAIEIWMLACILFVFGKKKKNIRKTMYIDSIVCIVIFPSSLLKTQTFYQDVKKVLVLFFELEIVEGLE